MNKWSSHLVFRALAVLMAGVGIVGLIDDIAAGTVGGSIAKIGLIFLGIASFLQPPEWSWFLPSFSAASEAAAIGPRRLRAALSVIGLGCGLFGLLLRYVLNI